MVVGAFRREIDFTQTPLDCKSKSNDLEYILLQESKYRLKAPLMKWSGTQKQSGMVDRTFRKTD